MKIQVKQKHINRARKLCKTSSVSSNCPISLAIKEKTHKYVCTQSDCVVIDEKEYDLPTKAKSFIKRFDNDKSVKPIKFEI